MSFSRVRASRAFGRKAFGFNALRDLIKLWHAVCTKGKQVPAPGATATTARERTMTTTATATATVAAPHVTGEILCAVPGDARIFNLSDGRVAVAKNGKRILLTRSERFAQIRACAENKIRPILRTRDLKPGERVSTGKLAYVPMGR